MKTHPYLYGALGLSMLAAIGCSKAKEESGKRPNILFIMSDDHAYQAISAYGYGLNKTPNIDRLANEGAIFTRAGVTNSICAPSRAVMLTGKHSFVNGKVDNIQPFDWNQQTFPKVLRANGYETAMIGKIHLDGNPQGFDYSMVLEGQGRYYNPDFIINGEKKRITGYCTDIVTDAALDWLKNRRDQDKPFCLLYHQKAPHRNWMPAPEYLNLFDSVNFTPPANYFDDYAGRGSAAKQQKMRVDEIMRMGLDLKLLVDANGDSTNMVEDLRRMTPEQQQRILDAYTSETTEFNAANLTGEELSLWKYNRYMRDYLSCIQSVDDGVGELLGFLEENGLDENTIIVYTSDQGFYLGEHGWFDKRFMYQESYQTPLLVRYPKEIEPGTKIDKLVQNLDFAPTLLDYAGVEIPADIQGQSFRKLVAGDTDEFRDFAYYTYYEYPAEHSVKRHNGIATERYKLIHFYYDVDEWELYDLEKDPSEMNNVFNDPEYESIKDDMMRKFKKTRKHYGDSDQNDQKFIDLFVNQNHRH
ncbi:sulfatase [Mangrovibacterium sp.]|uniref:sulfatase family protein n=1 Tax=Mangrovibacterium sp. TaxID=1961364 RepID=UPI00356A1BC3